MITLKKRPKSWKLETNEGNIEINIETVCEGIKKISSPLFFEIANYSRLIKGTGVVNLWS
jgi:hypothetical protein